MEEVEAFLALSHIQGLGAKRIKNLVEYFGSAKDALKGNIDEIVAITKYSKLKNYWTSTLCKHEWKEDLELAIRLKIDLISYTDTRYPKALLETGDHPALLYVKGKLTEPDKNSIAIVGTRNATIYGLEMARKMAEDLSVRGFTVISGLARGIDTAAHQGAMSKGRTIAIIGSGLMNIYPRENEKLAKDIENAGAVISEYSMRTPPERQNFPQRNRIISGLTLGTLLIEAPSKSGAMITMGYAEAQHKKLFAIPGRADIEGFRGNHLLIKNGKAALVENAEDIASKFCNLNLTTLPQRPKNQHFFLDEQEQRLLNVMPTEEIGVDNLALLMDLPVYQINTTLMGLVLKKAIKEFPGKIYKKQIYV